jgi:hypothetical protein
LGLVVVDSMAALATPLLSDFASVWLLLLLFVVVVGLVEKF